MICFFFRFFFEFCWFLAIPTKYLLAERMKRQSFVNLEVVIIGVARIFDWGAQTTNHMQWRHQKLQKRNFLRGQRYRRMEDQMPWPGGYSVRNLELLPPQPSRKSGQWKKKKKQSSFCLQFKSKTRLKSCILGLNFVRDLAQVGGSKVPCLLQYFSSK